MDKMELIVLATSDVHSNIFSESEENLHGMDKAATIIKDIRKNNQYVILIDNGDLIQGTPLANYAINAKENFPHPAVMVHNLLQYDAAIIGNHEFNFGKEGLDKVFSQANFPWLSANVVKKGTNTPYFGKPYIIKEFNGLRIAVLGLTTKFIPNWEPMEHIQAFDFLDPVDTAKKWVTYLKNNEQVDLIIVSYHGGLEKNPATLELIGKDNGENQGYMMATEVEGIDCLITGHQHLTFASNLANGVTVLQPGFGASHVGKITILLSKTDGKWHVEDKYAGLIPTREAKQDRETINTVKPFDKLADEWLDQKIGRIVGNMTIKDPMYQVWLNEHPFIEWINKVQMKVSQTEISCTALLNSNIYGLSETVSRKNIMKAYPFPNTLVVMKLTGDEIKKALEVSASFFLLKKDGEVTVNTDWTKPRLLSYNYDMWEGIEYEIDLNQPIGSRIRKVTYKGMPICDKSYYKVVMNNYRASGSGGYYMFSQEKVIKRIHKEISELLIEDIIEKKIIHANANSNWRVIY